jgi:hypothetical protein
MININIQYSKATPNDFVLDYDGSKFKFNIQLFLAKLEEAKRVTGTDKIIPIYANFSLQTRSKDSPEIVNLVFETNKNGSPLQVNALAHFVELEHSLRNLTNTPTTNANTTPNTAPDPNLPPIFPVSSAPLEKARWFYK